MFSFLLNRVTSSRQFFFMSTAMALATIALLLSVGLSGWTGDYSAQQVVSGTALAVAAEVAGLTVAYFLLRHRWPGGESGAIPHGQS